MQPNAPHLERIRSQFLAFADRECRGSSPLYEALSRIVADDAALLGIAATVRSGQPAPNMLLGAVHALLMRGGTEPLRGWYGDLVDDPRDPSDVAGAFKDFCRRHEADLTRILGTRVVNTNEVARSAILFPAFAHVARLARSETIHPLEIGAAAGFNLLWAHHAYDYGTGSLAGDPNGRLVLRCEPRGAPVPDLAMERTRFAPPVGVDPHPIDVRNDDDALWLKALVWPEHEERAARLSLASELVRSRGVDLRRGDGADAVPEFAGTLPSGGALCVYHSFTENQMAPAARRTLDDSLTAAARVREVFRVGLEWLREHPAPTLWVDHYTPSGRRRQTLATGDTHGRWIAWGA